MDSTVGVATKNMKTQKQTPTYLKAKVRNQSKAQTNVQYQGPTILKLHLVLAKSESAPVTVAMSFKKYNYTLAGFYILFKVQNELCLNTVEEEHKDDYDEIQTGGV